MLLSIRELQEEHAGLTVRDLHTHTVNNSHRLFHAPQQIKLNAGGGADFKKVRWPLMPVQDYSPPYIKSGLEHHAKDHAHEITRSLWPSATDAIAPASHAFVPLQSVGAATANSISDAMMTQRLKRLNDTMLKRAVDETLESLAPRAAEQMMLDGNNFLPMFDRLCQMKPRVVDEAKDLCRTTVLSKKKRIFAFCEDINAYEQEGVTKEKSAIECIHRTIKWISRAIRDGVREGVDALKRVLPRGLKEAWVRMRPARLDEFVRQSSSTTISLIEENMKTFLHNLGAPDALLDLIEFEKNSDPEDARDDEEPEKVARAKRLAARAREEKEAECVPAGAPGTEK